MTRTNETTRNLYTQAEAIAREPNINAFQDGTELHIHINRGETATTIHESVHSFSHDSYSRRVGSKANEGTTEYFTRVICTEQGIIRGNIYPDELRSVEKLVATSSREILAAAYFQGNIADLENTINSAKGAGTFAQWITFMCHGQFASADALL
jgi:hypothetical protein